ncbi:hypothetical protein C7H19_16995 [Aphanothece hegewaldii CCALA 016]|uniref:Uncharacterized protein n=1 Tax=Aphanothece hegewaldii CCALA 016 TaxID=2107694 RepID=A0A2T1LUS3_9CHRO|nr:alr0857 family protein [Aphanothece hegewaldii]PSF35256.1 hypothetical protein C7H19_16995 [Aphanothece hegewaldii CCALA 016]
MLKLTYTTNGFHLEHLSQSIEEWVNTRVLLAMRSGTGLSVEPSTACFLLPQNLANLDTLEEMGEDTLSVSMCDADSVEISLEGTWLSSNNESEEGLFVCVMDESAEIFLYQLWKTAQYQLTVNS